MGAKLPRWIAGAARLTQQGRLQDAAALLQQRLQSAFLVPTVRARTTRRAATPTAPRRATPDVRTTTATFVGASHEFDGMTRRYKLFTPARLAKSPGLVVMLHGCTQDADDFAAGTRVNEAAERDGFLVLYPQQSRDANPSACWNWFGAREQQGGGEAAFIADLTRRIVDAHDVDPTRVYIAGMSAGGAMAAIVAAANPSLFAAVGVHSGLPAGAAGNLPDALHAMRDGARRKTASTVPVIVFHGADDHTVHPSNGDGVVASIVGDAAHTVRKSTGPAAGPGRYTRTEYVEPGGRVVAEQWLLHGAGHAWAGGDPRGSYTDATGVDVTTELIRFFASHPR